MENHLNFLLPLRTDIDGKVYKLKSLKLTKPTDENLADVGNNVSEGGGGEAFGKVE